MNRLAVAMIVVFTLLSTFGFAQDSTPKVQVFGGYSLFHADNGRLTPTALYTGLHEPNNPFAVASNFNGWDAEAQYNVNHWLGIAGDIGGHSGEPITASRGKTLSGLPNETAYSLLVGPVISFRNDSRLTPFIHVLFGFDRASLSTSTISGVSLPLSTSATTFTDAAVALGGGLDFKISRRLAVRLVQIDDLETTHNLNKFYDSAFNTALFEGLATHERNLRVSAGVVVRF